MKLKISFAALFAITLSALPAQNYNWSKKIGGTGDDRGRSIAVDGSGNTYITGHFSGTADFDPGTAVFNLTAMGTVDMFIAKYNAAGNFVWAFNAGGSSSNNTAGKSIAVDGSGNVFVTGYFYGTADLDATPTFDNFTSSGLSDVFISKYNSAGSYQWTKTIGSSNADVGYNLAVDGNGDVHVTGSFEGTADFDPGAGTATLLNVGSEDIFFAKYDGNGNYIWAKSVGSSSSDYGYGIALDINGNCYVTGYFNASADFNPGAGTNTLSPVSGDDFFIAKYDANGNHVWAKGIGGSGNDYSYNVAVDQNSDVFVTGFFEGTVDFDPSAGTNNVTSSGLDDIFFAKYNGSGTLQWAKNIGGTGTFDFGSNLAVSSTGDCYVTGRFTGTGDFDPGAGTANLTSSGLSDIYFAKYNNNGDYQFAYKVGSTGDDYSYSIAVDASQNIYLTGFFRNTVDFDPGTGTSSLTSSGVQDVFIAKYSYMVVSASAGGVACYNNNGTATASVTGGTGPFTYSWSTSPVQTGATASGLAAGNYTVTVTDAMSVNAIATVTLSSPSSPNSWTQKANFGGGNRYGAVAFSIGVKGYMGTGSDGTSKFSDFWEYDPATDTWTQKANYGGGARLYAVGFSLGSKGFICTGQDNAGNGTTDNWEFSPTTNTWTQRSFFTSTARYGAVAVTISNKAIVGTGINAGSALTDFYEYDPTTDTWSYKTNFISGGRYFATAFAIGTKMLFGTGINSSGTLTNDFYEYNSINNSWVATSYFPGTIRSNCAAFAIGNRGYVGTGSDGPTGFTDFYEYNSSNYTWTQKANVPGMMRGSAAGFSIGNKGYIATGQGMTGTTMQDMFEYAAPLSTYISSQDIISCYGGNTGTATATPVGGTPPYSFAWNTVPVQTSATATGLTSGSYTVTITDCNGNTATASASIAQAGPQDSWTSKANIANAGTIRSGAFAFSIGSKGYIGCGGATGTWATNDLWEYDAATNVWTQKNSPGAMGRREASGFSIGNKGYVICGYDGNSFNFNEFWEYDPTANAWTAKANFPGGSRRGTCAFVIGTKAYVGMGYDGTVYKQDFYEWDQTSNSWNAKANFGGGLRTAAIGFTLNNKGYAGLGNNGNETQDIWEYDPISDTWAQKNNFPSARYGAATFTINGVAFAGAGRTATGSYYSDWYDYDPTNDAWTSRANYSGGTKAYTAAFAVNGKGYMGTGYNGTSDSQDFFEYNPIPVPAVANFTSVNAGQTFTFTNTSQNATAYEWDFGDGSTSTDMNPVHTYNVGGTYNVCLSASGNCVSDSFCTSITFGCVPPASNFSSNTSGLTTTFTNTSTNATSYSWNFGDGNSSTGTNPVHVYANSGTYSVTLTSSNGCGTSAFTQTVNVSCVAPAAAYTYTVNGLTANFTSTSSNAASVSWNFDDPSSGTSNSSASASTSHVFSAAGLYNVALIVSNGCGTDTITQSVLVNCASPQSAYYSFVNGLNAQFNASNSVGAFSYSWDFGNGQTAGNFPTPSITYTTSGTYNVCLTTSNACGTDTKCDSVTVCLPPSASTFTITPAANTVTVNYSGQGTNLLWNFNDGTGGNQNPVTHAFSSSGSKTICLKASNSCGSDSVCKTIQLFCFTGIPQICMVTVDTASTHNIIFWDTTGFMGVDTFLVQREITLNNYSTVGKVAYGAIPEFHDMAANPNGNTFRYKLGAMDTCGTIGDTLSFFHNTVYIQQTNGTFNWSGTEYKIENIPNPVNYYVLERDSLSNGIWDSINSCPGTQFVLTDNNWANQAYARWRIRTIWTISCDALIPAAPGGNNNVFASITKSRSNIQNNRAVTAGLTEMNASDLSIYPNPVKEQVTLEFNLTVPSVVIELLDVTGRVVHAQQTSAGTAKTIIQTGSFANGIYVIRITSANGMLMKKLVIEK
jgi:PKD repeat protein